MKLLKTIITLFALTLTPMGYTMPSFQSNVLPIQPQTAALMKQYTWKPSCPVSLDDLVEVHLSYWGFDHKTHQGMLIINKALAGEVVTIFQTLYQHRFPIQNIQLIENFKGDDDAAMAANVTSSFNCRPVTSQPGVYSQHSYGRAIDINPLINPYVKKDLVLPPAGKQFTDRNGDAPGKITKHSLIYTEFKNHGWDWGGDWFDLQDFQHFEKRANNQKRNPYGYAKQ